MSSQPRALQWIAEKSLRQTQLAALRRWAKRRVFAPGKRLVAGAELRRYMRETHAPKLNVGAGGNRIPGWLNVDLCPGWGITFMDASRPWPLADRSIDAVLCEHMIEHVPKGVGVHMLQEMRRILKPDGWVRIVTPDLDWLASRILHPASQQDARYLRFLNEFIGGGIESWCDVANVCFYGHGHRYIWSIDALRSELTRCGFAELVVTRAAHPEQRVFHGCEGHPRVIGVENDAVEAFAIEARASTSASIAASMPLEYGVAR